MLLATASAFALLVSAVSAHFQMQFPVPRGPFVEDDEPNFCDGYTSVTNNRTTFPMSGGFVTFNSEHPEWTAAILVSTKAGPSSFDDFSKTFPVNFFKGSGENTICIPLSFNSSIDGVKDGANVTIQVEYTATDGNLFQCADLTLSANASVPQDVTCSNPQGGTLTSSSSNSSSSASASATSPSGGASQTSKPNGVAKLYGTPSAFGLALGALLFTLL